MKKKTLQSLLIKVKQGGKLTREVLKRNGNGYLVQQK